MVDERVVKYFVALSKMYPVIAYNYPLATGYDITPAIIKKILQAEGNVIGIKDPIPDLRTFSLSSTSWGTTLSFIPDRTRS